MSKNQSQRFVTLVNDALTRITEISPKKVWDKLEKEDEFELLDVREREEWEKSRISGADYLGKGVIEQEIESEVPDTDREIVLYSGGGYRALLAADNLQKMGYHDVKSLKGGFRAWCEAGLPIEKEEA